jgi:hypothetical protein
VDNALEKGCDAVGWIFREFGAVKATMNAFNPA